MFGTQNLRVFGLVCGIEPQLPHVEHRAGCFTASSNPRNRGSASTYNQHRLIRLCAYAATIQRNDLDQDQQCELPTDRYTVLTSAVSIFAVVSNLNRWSSNGNPCPPTSRAFKCSDRDSGVGAPAPSSGRSCSGSILRAAGPVSSQVTTSTPTSNCHSPEDPLCKMINQD